MILESKFEEKQVTSLFFVQSTEYQLHCPVHRLSTYRDTTFRSCVLYRNRFQVYSLSVPGYLLQLVNLHVACALKCFRQNFRNGMVKELSA